MITFLVRHADAGDKRSWDGPDGERRLSRAGLRQAEGLVTRLEDYPVGRILCSPTVRCLQTVQPLARGRLLPIQPAPAPEPLHWPKGSTWLLHHSDRREVHAHYLPPLALDDTVHSG